MPIPNFLIIGAAKSATTSLASLLDNHPEAGICKPKEPHFFSVDANYALGMEHYTSLFKDCGEKIAIGDASTSYSRLRSHPSAIDRIKQHLDSPKIIYMVRHPIRRIESAYVEQMTLAENASIKSINEAIEKLPMMVDSSRYWEVYSAYRKHFSKNDIHVVWFEDYIANQSTVFQNVCAFLEIDSTLQPELENESSNNREFAKKRVTSSAKLNQNWDKRTLAKIKNSLKKDNTKFLHYFGKSSNYWR